MGPGSGSAAKNPLRQRPASESESGSRPAIGPPITVPDLSLRQLNEATLAWMEMEYHRKPHAELGNQTRLLCYLDHKDMGRPCPATQDLQLAFTAQLHRSVRRLWAGFVSRWPLAMPTSSRSPCAWHPGT
jgi:hypothetical protein